MITAPWLGLLAALCLLPPGVLTQQNGGTLDCRVNGNMVTVELRIDTNKYPSVCPTATDGKPIFQSSPDGALPYPKTECTVIEDIRPAAACTWSYTPGSNPCGCTGKNTSTFSVDYNFEYTPDKNKWYTATIQCTLPPPQLSQAITFPTCTVEIPTTTTTTTTEETTTTTTTPTPGTTEPPTPVPSRSCDFCDCNGDCGAECAGCVIVILLGIVVGFCGAGCFVLYALYYCGILPPWPVLKTIFKCLPPPPSPNGGCNGATVDPKDGEPNSTDNGATRIDGSNHPLTGVHATSNETSRPS